jgi:membrane-bound lytic murein transglycosylase D
MRNRGAIRQLSLGTLFLAAVALSSCQSARTGRYRASFLPAASVPVPPTPDPAPADAIGEPPELKPRLFIDHTPSVFRTGRLSEKPPSPTELAIQTAESHFRAGKVKYQAGEFDAARAEFDRAIDVLLQASEDPAGRQSLGNKLDELIEAIYRYDVSGLSSGDPGEDPGYDKPPLEDIPAVNLPVDPATRGRILERLRATASQLPLDINDEVLRYIQYFSAGRGRKILLAGLRRAGRYRPLIEKILAEEGVPQELIHLAQAESGFHPRAVSRKRATGMWQFMLSRGRQYGLERTKTSDDRLDPEKATRAAARHLKDLYTQFGDWYLAIAAYNCGPVTVQRAVERTGYADVWELRRRNVLPRETSSYVPIVLAMAAMAKNPSEYGLEGLEEDPPLEYDTVAATAPTSLVLVADIVERPVSELRELNPALLKSVAPPGCTLRVPKGTAGEVASILETIPEGQRAAWRIHRVNKGETLAAIARRYRAAPGGISRANGIDGKGLESGDLLLIPQPAPARSAKKAGMRSQAATRSKKSAVRGKNPLGRNTATVASRKTAGQRSRSLAR